MERRGVLLARAVPFARAVLLARVVLSSRAVLLALALLAAPLHDVAAADRERPWLGLPLIEALERLRSQGLRVNFSTAIVTPGLRVNVEPRATEPRGILDEILRPLGLSVIEGPGGALLVIADTRAAPVRPMSGRVLAATSGVPVVGATVRFAEVETRTRPDGSFTLAGLPAGPHALTVNAPGFAVLRLEGETAGGDGERGRGDRERVLFLQPLPGYVEEIVVTPGRHALVREEPSSRRSLDQQEAALVPQVGGDVARTIESLPGVAAADNSSAFNLRGSEARDVSLILDGLELYDPFHLQPLQSPFSVIDDRLVETIEVLGGGFTAELGDRRGGFVELSTALPAGPGGTRLELGTVNSAISYGSSTAAGSLLLAARGWYPETVATTLELGEPGFEPRFLDAYVKSSFVVSPRSVLSLHALLASDRVEFREADGNEEVSLVDRSGHVWLRALQSWTPEVFTETVFSAGRLDRRRTGSSEPEDEVIAVDDARTVDFFGLRSDLIWNVSGSQLVKVGILARPLQAEYDYSSGPVGDPASGTALHLDPSGWSYGVYVAHRAALSERFATEIGLRWDRQAYLDDAQWSPRFNALWRTGERSELRVGVGRFCQSQRIHELDVQDGTTAFAAAEVARQIDLTFQHRFERGLRFRFDAYDAEISDVRPRHENLFNPLELFPETSPDRVLIAPDSARLRGAEILLGGALGRPFQWWGSVTWSSAEDRIDGRHEPRAWDQPLAARILLGWRRADRWSVSVTGSARSGWPTTPVTGVPTVMPDGSTEIVPVPGRRNSERFSTYARIDLKTAWFFRPAWGRVGLELDITNLTDTNNSCCLDDFRFDTRPDGSVETVADVDTWLGLIPSFSLSLEF